MIGMPNGLNWLSAATVTPKLLVARGSGAILVVDWRLTSEPWK